MLDTALLFAQTVAVGGIAGWIVTGVYDNLRYPENNELYTAQVMSLARMREAYPAEYARVAHRAINDRRLQRWAFRIVVAVELVAALILSAAVLAMLLALPGLVDVTLARTLALVGAAVFTGTWMGFLVMGNYFCYWFCHEWGQNTHYQMTLWGLATLILLAQGG
jgi:predicted small integral membrane protein